MAFSNVRWLSLGLLLGMGCAADDAAEQAGETSAPVLAAPGDAPRGEALYFGVRPDFRRCAAPACGGSFVRALNRELTTCADGGEAAECYVADLDLRRLGLSDAALQQLVRERGRLVLVGTLQPSRKSPDFGSLTAERAYRGINDTAAGATLLTTRTGIVCIQAPCPTHQGLVVNQEQTLRVDPNLGALEAPPEERERVLRDPDNQGVLLSGRLGTPTIRTGVDALFDVTQAYLPVTAR